MDNKKYGVSIVLVFVYTYLVNYLLHSVFLENAYMRTLDLWRSQAEILGFLHLDLMVHVIFSIIIVQFFRDFVLSKKKPLLYDSLAAGLLIGEMIGIIQLSSYIFMPISPVIAIGWFTGIIIQCVGAAFIIHKIANKQ